MNTIPTDKVAETSKVDNNTPTEDSGKFELALRLLSNEVFAISISANPFNKRWIIYSLLTMGFLLFAVSTFGDSIVSFSAGMYSAINAE
jgi:hypothetical protein